jgi:DNA invertase Pin-like site-specific DNA recombinase
LRGAARRGEISVLYLFRLDRLTRSGIRDTLELLAELRRYGVRVTTVADSFSLDGDLSEVVIAVIAWAAQMEAAAAAERMAAARARVEAAGGKWGRPRRATGPLLERIHELRAQKFSIRQISQRLKIPRSTIGVIASEKGAYAGRRNVSVKTLTKKREHPPSK